jgi:hypothetical protein
MRKDKIVSTRTLGEPIPGTGNLYEWGKGQILKLYDDSVPEGWVEHLGKIERALYESGLPLPEVGELVEIEGSLGQVYERVEGPTMAEGLLGASGQDSEHVSQLARVFAEVQASIHACVPSGDLLELPLQRQLFPTVIRRTDRLPVELQEAITCRLDALPDGNRLCHGDFHPYNVLMSPRGPIVIDWNNAHIGNPLEDVARSRLMFSGLAVAEPSLRPGLDLFSRVYLERYFELTPDRSQKELGAWLPVVAAVRLSDRIPEIEEWLVDQIKAGLAQ